MSVSRWQTLLAIYRWTGIAIGIFLLVMDGFDAMLTPRPDWFWFGAGILLIWLCRPRKKAMAPMPSIDPEHSNGEAETKSA